MDIDSRCTMNDFTNSLRKLAANTGFGEINDAADEIERLRRDLEASEDEAAQLVRERDKALGKT